MDSARVIELVGTSRIIAIMRGDYRGAEVEIVAALAESGIRAVEITMNSPGALKAIRAMADRFGEEVATGAGTVMTVAQVAAVADAGASFVVSPNRDVQVIERTKLLGLGSFPGCFTPSEIVEAISAGADAVKLFPARVIPPALLADLRAPLGNVRMIPTGAIDTARASEYLASGAWALGIGSALVGGDVMETGGLQRLARKASEFVAAVQR